MVCSKDPCKSSVQINLNKTKLKSTNQSENKYTSAYHLGSTGKINYILQTDAGN